MNLHDIPTVADAVPRLRIDERYLAEWREWYYARGRPPGPVLPGDGGARVEFFTETYRTRTADRDRALRVGDILARLDRQYTVFARARLMARDLPMAAFVLPFTEAQLLRRELSPQEMARHGFPTQEGVENSYRGYPLVIQ
jgi:hypothetical protein